jgi:hypothetical protein
MTEQQTDPFASSESRPSVSFKDAPIGTAYNLKVTGAASLTQSRDYETGEPAEWPDGNPKMSAVVDVVDLETGEEKSLWAAKPSALFAAIGEAQRKAGSSIAVGGTLRVEYTGDKPNAKNPRLNPAKQYAVTYTPPDAFADGGIVSTPAATLTRPAAAPVADPQAAVAALAALSPEQRAALGIPAETSAVPF